MKILFVDDDDSIRDLFVLVLDNIFDQVQIVECTSGNNAIRRLQESSEYDLIISDFNMPNGTGSDLYDFILTEKIKTPFVLFTTESHQSISSIFPKFHSRENLDAQLAKNFDRKLFRSFVIEFVSKMVPGWGHLASQDQVPATEINYSKVRLPYFWRFNTTLCDVYLRLSDSGSKYIKIFNQGDNYSRSDIDRFATKLNVSNQKFLYINSKDYDRFSTSFYQTPFLIFDKEKILGQQEDVIVTTQAIIQEIAQSAGISSTAIKLSDESVNEIVKIVENDDFKLKLSSILKRVREQKDYLYDHSYLLSCVAAAICLHMDWTYKETIRKLSYAAIFHDITLDDPILAKVDNLDLEVLRKFPKEKIRKYQKHPQEIADMVREARVFPPGVDTIILQHHENAEGNGFPHQISPLKLYPLVAVFIIAHDFINRLYEVDFDNGKYESIIAAFQKRYNTGHFKKPMEALKKMYSSS
ncbi:MAG: response regulator [Oligoflexia bacterium]|nr:response regulator [Oligoflexia bacterium]